MNLLLILAIIIIVIFIFDRARIKANLEKYHKENNASFSAEVEEYAKWAEMIFADYCRIVGVENVLEESKNNCIYPLQRDVEFYYITREILKLTLEKLLCQ